MLVPVNQVLEFMGKGTVVVGAAGSEVIKAHVEHFTLVAVRADTGRIFILGLKVSTGVGAKAKRIEDGEVHVMINTGSPFAAKGSAFGGIDC